MRQAPLPDSRLPRRAGFPAWQIAALFVLLALFTAIPVLTHPLPPLSDYANHLARMHVIATGAADPALSRFYAIEWQPIPNLMMDLVVPLMGRAMNIYLAGQLYTAAVIVLTVSGTLALHRALFGTWSLTPLIAFPFVYNHVFLIGVMNYVFGIGLALWALAAWIALRDRPWPWRFGISILFLQALYFCHLFAVGVYGLGLLATEALRLWQWRGQPLAPRLAGFVATGLPFVPLLPLLVFSPTWTLAAENYWEPRGKIDGLVYIIEVYSDVVALGMAAVLAGAAVWAARRRLLHFHPLGWSLLLVGTAVYLIMPRVLFATYLADQRLPVALAFMVLACVQVDLHQRLLRRGFIGLLLMLLAVRIIEVDATWTALSGLTVEFRDMIRRVRPGSAILVAYADRSAGDDVRDLGLVHAPCLAMIERSSLVTTAFTVFGKQVLRARPEYRNRVDTQDGTPPSIGQLLLAADRPEEGPQAYWSHWPDDYDYLVVLFTDDDSVNPDPERLTMVHDGTRFQLYRINRTARVTTAPARP